MSTPPSTSTHDDPPRPSWIGVDVGGSGARACLVALTRNGLAPLGEPVTLDWPAGTWRPVPLSLQLADPAPPIAPDELEEGARRLDLLASLVDALCAGAPLPVALAFPGLRTPDGRGIAVWSNGPRLPDLLEALGRRLGSRSITHEIDGPAGALGELHGAGGALRDTRNAWYVAGGSGLAEAAIVDGEVVFLADTSLPQAWQLVGEPGGRTFEDLLAPRRVDEEWERLAGTVAPGFPEQRAAAGDPLARAFLDTLAERLAAYLDRRRADFRRAFGTDLERVAIGQRSVPLFAELELPPLVRLSTLRLAPALGAVAAARRRSSLA